MVFVDFGVDFSVQDMRDRFHSCMSCDTACFSLCCSGMLSRCCHLVGHSYCIAGKDAKEDPAVFGAFIAGGYFL